MIKRITIFLDSFKLILIAVPSINSNGIVILMVKKGEDKMRKVVDIIQEALDVPVVRNHKCSCYGWDDKYQLSGFRWQQKIIL